ncbi:MarR family winged helix-turn-helix transcriptional regulator [Sneathiella limimaris]|uniref:MarR family winged helix-turn-helix transcriptional regulator n=1 Tax=Sneathiella limimaris TaxID=1964213 RepID=UPI00146BBBB5|nr:MarR family transcriptional regulator [Sneathiella limimaris]
MTTKTTPLKLQNFLPYRLTKLSGIISRTLAESYSNQFDLSIHEWRIVAILGEQPGLTAREVGELASLDKVNISRAIDKLEKAGRLIRKTVAKDRRSFALFLTSEGEDVLIRIIPLALEYEKQLLSILSQEEKQSLNSILMKLDQSADQVAKSMISTD